MHRHLLSIDGAEKAKAAPSDLTGPPLEETDIAILPRGLIAEIFLHGLSAKGRGVRRTTSHQIIMMHKGLTIGTSHGTHSISAARAISVVLITPVLGPVWLLRRRSPKRIQRPMH